MNNKICLSISDNEIISHVKKYEKTADLIEIRADYIENFNEGYLSEILCHRTKPSILTIRRSDEGGFFKGSLEERQRLFIKAIELGVDYIDIEFSCGCDLISQLIAAKGKTKIICSSHNFKYTPPLRELEKLYITMNSLKPDIVKIVTYGNSINDNFIHFKLLKDKENLVSFSMGLKGQISRILSPVYGSLFTYASQSSGKETAEGQITAEELIETYNFHVLDRNTKILGVIGGHAENSLSKHMHNGNFKGDNLNYIYVPFKTEEKELPLFMENFRKFNFAGAAVTIPHKIDIMKYLYSVEDTAKKIGAVNTVVNKDGILKGYNTDCPGSLKALSLKTGIKGKKVLLLGAGGAARAIGYGLKEEGAEIIIANRTDLKAEKLAEELGSTFCHFEDIYNTDCNIIINTTSVGMYPHVNDTIVKKDFLKGKIVFDIVYRPMVTGMLRDAREVNSLTVEGYEMLLYQGIEQYKLWTGKDPSEKLMRDMLKKQLES
ncbi:MAG: shikimate dehydrogenase [Candidatus Eremiobacterota bacterium]